MFKKSKSLINKTTFLSISVIALTLALQAFSPTFSRTLAQIDESESQEFFDEGNQEREREIEILEEEKSPESTEERQEQDLVHPFILEENRQAPEIEDSPTPGMVDNVPTPPPLGEAEIKLPE